MLTWSCSQLAQSNFLGLPQSPFYDVLCCSLPLVINHLPLSALANGDKLQRGKTLYAEI